MQQTHDAPYYSDATRTKISNAQNTERRAGNLLAEKKRVVGEATKEVVEHSQWHDQTVRDLLRQEADDKARLGLAGLLAELTEGHGLGWSELARLVGVSVPAVRKWRNGGDITPPRMLALSRLAAFLEILSRERVQDPAAWLSLPLDDSANGVTKSEIYIAGQAPALLLYARQELSQKDLLERAGLRPTAPSRNELVMAEDGYLSIVPTNS